MRAIFVFFGGQRQWARLALALAQGAPVPLLDEPVTSFQQTAVVTEQGVARLWGLSEREQAAGIIENAAHPSVREELWEEARHMGLA